MAIFASGAGSNADNIIAHFKNHPDIQVQLVVSNKKSAGVLGIAAKHQIPTLIIDRESFQQSDKYVKYLQDVGINIIILAGFLWKVPQNLIAAFPERIINIHPALLPDYGGKGMYGQFVHEAVIQAKETESGITIHLVDEHYDHGRHLFQAKCAIIASDDPEKLAAKIHQLEHAHFPQIIEQYIKDNPALFTEKNA